MERLNEPTEPVTWDLNALGRLQENTSWMCPAGDWGDVRFHLFTLYAIARHVNFLNPYWAKPTKAPYCVEIGSREGASTLALCTAMRDTGGRLVSIDIDAHACEVSSSVIERAGLEQWHTMIQGDAAEVAPSITEPVDVLFIDGDHSEEAVRRDVENYAHKVRVNGFCLFHDYYSDAECLLPPVSPPYPSGVAPVVDEMLASGNWQGVVMPWSHGLAVLRRMR